MILLYNVVIEKENRKREKGDGILTIPV